MFTKSSLLNALFIDIETVPLHESFDELPPDLQRLWLEKHHLKEYEKLNKQIADRQAVHLAKGNMVVTPEQNQTHLTVNEVYLQSASLYAEFSRIWCISFGVFNKDYKKQINTLREESEAEMLEQLLITLDHFKDKHLFGFNIKAFDIPFTLKRMWINGLLSNYPPQLQLGDAKPWTITAVDVLENYKGMSMQYVTMELLCIILGIPSPKVNFANHEFPSLILTGKITEEQGTGYCEDDVSKLMDIALKLSSEESNYTLAPVPNKYPAKSTPYPKKEVEKNPLEKELFTKS